MHASGASSSSGALTPALLETAARRLKLIAGISSASAAVMAILDFFSPPVTASPVGRWIGFAAPCLGSMSAFTMFWLSSRLEPRKVVRLAPVFQVVQGFFISVYYHTA